MTISLTKENSGRGDGSPLDDFEHLRIGVSWDASNRGQSGFLGKVSKKLGVDLDLFAVLMQGNKPVRLIAGFDKDLMNPLHGGDGDGAIVHSGDNTTGKGEGIDEQIDVHLSRIPLKFTGIIFGVAAYKEGLKEKLAGDVGFKAANNVEFTVSNVENGVADERAAIMPSLVGTENCCLVTKLVRSDETDQSAPWVIEILEEFVRIKSNDQDSIIRACMDR